VTAILPSSKTVVWKRASAGMAALALQMGKGNMANAGQLLSLHRSSAFRRSSTGSGPDRAELD